MTATTSLFTKAVRHKEKARVAIHGPAKGGKSWSAMSVARGLVGPDGRIAAACTEAGALRKTCADYFDFYDILLHEHDPRYFIDVIEGAESEGFDAIVIDSLTHEWTGKGGILDFVNTLTSKSSSRNAFTEGWKHGTPLHDSLIAKITSSKIHVVATIRDRMKYVTERNPNNGQSIPRKIGLRPIQGKQIEYEFDILCRVESDHAFIVEGGRCRPLEGLVIPAEPTVFPPHTKLIRFGEQLSSWLEQGEVAPANVLVRPEVARLKTLFAEVNASPESIRSTLSKRGAAEIEQLTTAQAEEIIGRLEAMINNKTFAKTFPHVEPAKEEAEEQNRLRAERDAANKEVVETATA